MTGGVFHSPVIGNVTFHGVIPPVKMTGKTGPAQRPAIICLELNIDMPEEAYFNITLKYF